MQNYRKSYRGGGQTKTKFASNKTNSSFKPFIASSLALILGASIASADPLIQYGTSSATQTANLSGLTWISKNGVSTPQSNSTVINTLTFKFEKGTTTTSPTGSLSDTNYTITYQGGTAKDNYSNKENSPIAPSTTTGSTLSFDAKGQTIRLGNSGEGKIVVDFGDYTTTSKRQMIMKFNGGAVSNGTKYSLIGGLDIYSGDESTYNITFANSVKGNITIYANSFRQYDQYISGTNGTITFGNNANLEGSLKSDLNANESGKKDANTRRGGVTVTFGNKSNSNVNTKVTGDISFGIGTNTINFNAQNTTITGKLGGHYIDKAEGYVDSDHYAIITSTNTFNFYGNASIGKIVSNSGTNTTNLNGSQNIVGEVYSDQAGNNTINGRNLSITDKIYSLCGNNTINGRNLSITDKIYSLGGHNLINMTGTTTIQGDILSEGKGGYNLVSTTIVTNNLVLGNGKDILIQTRENNNGFPNAKIENFFDISGETSILSNVSIKAQIPTRNFDFTSTNIFKFGGEVSFAEGKKIAELTAHSSKHTGNFKNVLSFDGTSLQNVAIGDINKEGTLTQGETTYFGSNYIGKDITIGEGKSLALYDAIYSNEEWKNADHQANVNLTVTGTINANHRANYINVNQLIANNITSSNVGGNSISSGANNFAIGERAIINGTVSGTTNFTLNNNASITFKQGGTITTIAGGGSINLAEKSADKTDYNILTVGSTQSQGAFSGDYNLLVSASRNGADRIVVDGTNSTGSLTISATGNLDEILSISSIDGVEVANVGGNDITVQGGESSIDGVIFNLGVEGDGSGKYIINNVESKGIDTSVQDIASSALTVNYDLYLANFNSLNKRMGELRDNPYSQGVWARIFGGATESSFGSGSKTDYVTAQGGYDYSLTFGNARNYMGVAIAYGKSWTDSTKSTGLSTASLDSVNSNMVEVGIYNSYVEDSGWYNDTILKFDYIMSDFTLSTSANTSSYSANNFAIVLSDEFGYRYKFGSDKSWYVDPQFEMALGYFDQSDFNHALNASGNVLMKTSQDLILTLRTRFGASVGKKLVAGEGFATIYGGVFYEYDYIEGGNTQTQVFHINNNWKELESNGRMLLNIGTNVEVADGARLYLDVEKSFFGKVNVQYQVNFGARYSFGEKAPTTEWLEQQKKKGLPLPLKVNDNSAPQAQQAVQQLPQQPAQPVSKQVKAPAQKAK